MTNWNLSYDNAALFIFILIFVWYFSEKRIPTKSHRAFLNLICLISLATALEIASTLLARHVDVVGYTLFYDVLTAQTWAVNLVPIAFAYYMLVLAHIDVHEYGLGSVVIPLCIGYDTALCLLNVAFRFVFSFEHEAYRILPVGMSLYVIDAFMIALCFVILIRRGGEFLYIQLFPLVFTLVSCIFACVMQVVYYVPMLNIMLATLCLTLYYYQQNARTVTDAVTGQFNRKFLSEYVQSLYLDHKNFGVIVLAMDGFKFANKTYGVRSGDQLLHQVGWSLEHLKGNQVVFRFGSDQFCVVLDKNMDQMQEMAEEIVQNFRHPWYLDENSSVMLSATLCCIKCPKDAANYDTLIEVIDYSMSVAKNTNKGQITYAQSVRLDKIQQDKAIERAVQLAIDRDELQVFYQPIYAAKEGVYHSAEALVRLYNEELGWISPEQFIPIAEKNGLIVQMGDMILEKVCRFIRDFRLSETTIDYVEVNISPIQLMQRDFAQRVKAILDRYGVQPSQINIEITETADFGMEETINTNISELVAMGITFSLDDYGSGNANIDYINRMPFSIIKLDKYIVWDSFKSRKAEITLQHTIGMLNALELYIIAEGVETEEMRDKLKSFGCHYMQGWLYSKAIPDSEFIDFIASENA